MGADGRDTRWPSMCYVVDGGGRVTARVDLGGDWSAIPPFNINVETVRACFK